MSLEKFTAFKIKDSAQAFADFIRTHDAKNRQLPPLRPLQLPAEINFDGQIQAAIAFKVHSGQTKTQDDIPWISFLNEGTPGEPINFSSRNKFPCAVMAISLLRNGVPSFYALTFGIGAEAFIDPELLVRDFGLRVAMNICDVEKLKRIQTSIHEAISAHAEKQISTGSSLTVFGINDEKEFLRSVTGIAKADYDFISSFTGKDSISVKLSRDQQLSWVNIAASISSLGEAYDLDDYETIFQGYAKFHIENDPEKIETLDLSLFERIREGNFDNIHLAPPEFIDFDNRSFSYSATPDTLLDDISIESLLESRRAFSERSSMKSIKGMHIHVWNTETGVKIKEWQAYRCLVAEIELNNATYILSMGQWKQISDDFKGEVDRYLETIQSSNFEYLPNGINIWVADAKLDRSGNPVGENREEAYNQAVAGLTQDIFLFDKAKVQIADEKIYEICDLLHSEKHFVHVKRLKSGSASITHLFLQGKFYSDAFLSDRKCRESMRTHINANSQGRDPVQFISAVPDLREQIVANDYLIIFCLLTEQAGKTISDLPFMSRYELMHAHKHIHEALGFRCEVAFRSVVLGP
ncbi:DUF6119 family protein [Pseudomonas frederiksbergensis]|uniref:DUF6119 family protein n=1 Tax=Pseudomonas frederiksbergensis TaxID=104087 RepID=UPI0032E49CCE